MRAVVEALLIVGGALAVFTFVYRGWLKLRREQRQADLRQKREEEAWLDSQINGKE